jgi:hypothetical protein
MGVLVSLIESGFFIVVTWFREGDRVDEWSQLDHQESIGHCGAEDVLETRFQAQAIGHDQVGPRDPTRLLR